MLTMPLKLLPCVPLSSFHQLGMRFIDKRISISCFTRSHINNGLVSLLHWSRFDPCLNVFLSSKLKHFLSLLLVLHCGFQFAWCYLYFVRGTNGAASNLDPLSNQRKRIDCRKIPSQYFRSWLNTTLQGISWFGRNPRRSEKTYKRAWAPRERRLARIFP